MNSHEAKKRINSLKGEINYHRHLYHVYDRSEISDAALDSLKKELFDLELQFPELVTLDSPTQRIGGSVLSAFQKVQHEQRMLSLYDAFSDDDVDSWIQRMHNYARQQHFEMSGVPEFFAEIKMDGLALSLRYEQGILQRAATRGDGYVGENVTAQIKTIDAIPLRLSRIEDCLVHQKELADAIHAIPHFKEVIERAHTGVFEVRGEVYMKKSVLRALNEQAVKNGSALLSNPRNAAAGSIRQLDPTLTASRRLSFYAYETISDCGQKTHEESHMIARILGIPVNPLVIRCTSRDALLHYFHEFEGEKRDALDYETDGVVIHINDNVTHAKLGVVGKAPRGSIALKWPPLEAISVVEAIEIQVGRTGVLTPVARVRKTNVGGVIVQNVTLHNEDQIRRLDIRVGDTVVLARAGDVIPEVVRVLSSMREKNIRKFRMPVVCPTCNSPVARRTLMGDTVSAATYCTNYLCSAQQHERLRHFVSKHAFNIDGLGEKIIERFMEEGLLVDAASLFELTRERIAPLSGFGEQSADNLVSELHERRRVETHRLLFALGIEHVGEVTARYIAGRFATTARGAIERPTSLMKFIDVHSVEDLESWNDVGPVVANSIKTWFDDERNRHLLARLDDVQVTLIVPQHTQGQGFQNLRFLFTGELTKMSREEAQELVRAHGGKPVSSVSSKTDYVVVGENPGSKRDKALQQGIKILNEEDFLKLITTL